MLNLENGFEAQFCTSSYHRTSRSIWKNPVTLLIIPIFRHIYMRKGNGLDVFCRTAEEEEKADAPSAAALKVQFPNTLPVNLNPE